MKGYLIRNYLKSGLAIPSFAAPTFTTGWVLMTSDDPQTSAQLESSVI